MKSIFDLLMLALLALMVVGMFKPAVVLPKFLANKSLPNFLLTRLQTATDNPTRWQVLKWYSIVFLIVVIFGTNLMGGTSFDQEQAKKLVGKWDCKGSDSSALVAFGENGSYSRYQPGDPANSIPALRYDMTLHGAYSYKDGGIYVVSNYWEAPQQDQYLANHGLPLISSSVNKDYFIKIKILMDKKLTFDIESRKKDGSKTNNNHGFNCSRL